MISRLVLNLKMHEVSALLGEYRQLDLPLDLLVPFPYLEQARRVLKDSLVRVGAQDVSAYPSGAHTGQVSHEMLKYFGVSMVLIGHQEVGDSREVLKEKLALTQRFNMDVLYCVSGLANTPELIEQLSCLSHLKGVSVAYEPVGAIGSGDAAGVDSINAAVQFIKAHLQKTFPSNSDETTVLYGGSVNNNNCLEILRQTQVDGLLIGGASLDMTVLREVVDICKQF
jgi:triosephosphate isomerase